MKALYQNNGTELFLLRLPAGDAVGNDSLTGDFCIVAY